MSRIFQETEAMGRTGTTRGQIWLYVIGYIVLIGGSIASARAYHLGFAYDARNAVLADPIITKQNDQRLEMIGGKSNVFANDVQQWFIGLWHGTHLAYTLAVLTLVIAGLCFFAAYFLPDFPPFDDRPLETSESPRGKRP
jgi:hypothetical protein